MLRDEATVDDVLGFDRVLEILVLPSRFIFKLSRRYIVKVILHRRLDNNHARLVES